MNTERASKRRAAKDVPGATPTLNRKDFESDQDVRWCPGCGDYSILAQTQRLLPELGIPKEKHVFISGIGCSSRFPYYMDTYGFHTIHGRAPTIASGLKSARPDLAVWIITGDGDALSIGGNHFIHLVRRNIDVNVLLFNNQIYGLTKGQYSPTSEQGKVTKSTPVGSVDPPFNPLRVALAAGATFVARTLDRDTKHLQEMIKAAFEHRGTSIVEIFQNCLVFNDAVFHPYTERDTKPENTVLLEAGKPLIYGANQDKGIRFNGLALESVPLDDEAALDDLVVHDPTLPVLTIPMLLSETTEVGLPSPLGIFRQVEQPCYEDLLVQQIETAQESPRAGDLEALLNAGDTWQVE